MLSDERNPHPSEIQPGLFDRQVLNQIPDGILVVDDLGDTVFLNSAARRIFGLEETLMQGLPVRELLPEWSELPARVDGKDVWGTRSDGKRVELEVSTSLAHTLRGVLALVSVRDVSGRREKASKIATEREVLEDEIQVLKAHESHHFLELNEAARVLES